MQQVRRKSIFVLALAIFVVSILAAISLTSTTAAQADGIEDIDSYTFTLVTSSSGEQGYSVSIKTAKKPSVETVIIPETYNGLPVTEIANNGFMACAKLQKVILPVTIKKIGNNAFMNCAKLERISLASVESIGMNAFALCPLLDRTYIPNTVKSVGANVFRNNANTIFVQSSEEEVASEWQSTWNSYCTGNIVYGIEPENTVGYLEILNDAGSVIGYEVAAYQMITAQDADIVIYNSFRPDAESEYLPVLNICSEAFAFSQANSITVKDRRSEDDNAPVFTHKINIRSNAFVGFWGQEVHFEIGVSFDHPEGLQQYGVAESWLDSSEIVGDGNGKSVRIFEASEIKTVTLPSDIDFIPERMFFDCAYLTTIKFTGSTEENTLTSSITRIGTGAFSSCVNLLSLFIPSSVLEVGEATFYGWGDGENKQALNLDYYEGYIPDTWSDDWFCGNELNTAINYKALTEITIDMQDNLGTKLAIGIKPGLEMPVIDKFERAGYRFKGIYSEQDGGRQYYSDEMTVMQQWDEGEPTTIYAHWQIIEYDIVYPEELNGLPNPNPTKYTIEDSIEFIPFDHEGYRYTFIPNKIEVGTTGLQKVYITKTTINYDIQFDVDDLKGCENLNEKQYNVEQEIIFIPLECEGYTFTWAPSGISVGTTGHIKVKGIWTPKEYNITYKVIEGTTHSNPNKYTHGSKLILEQPTYGGYYVTWDMESIPEIAIGDITITAIYTEKTLNECYNNGVYEIWTKNQFEQLREQPNGGQGREYRVCRGFTAANEYGVDWEPLSAFNGTIDGQGHSITKYVVATTTGSNFGFCRVNNGTIKDLTLGFAFYVGDEKSNISIGTFAGINKGSIINCRTMAIFNRVFYRCYARGDSYAGCFVGVNEGVIDGCYGGDMFDGSCNMGGIAGKNTNVIKNCNASSVYLRLDYYDYNANLGGIVGLQTAGSVTNCTFLGDIRMGSYKSDKFTKDGILGDTDIQPCAGFIVGRKTGGSVSGSVIHEFCRVYPNSLKTITWTSGVWPWKQEHSHDQSLYFREAECGRIG